MTVDGPRRPAPATAGPGALADRLLADLRVEFPRLRIVLKQESGLSRAIDAALRVLTLGRQSSYMTSYVTTLGSTIYVPSDWEGRSPADRYVTLRHEAIHLRQFRRLTWLGMALLYLLPIFPVGLALGRTLLERRAYAETLRAIAEVRGGHALGDPALRARIVRQFTSGAYGWMWPFPRAVEAWFDRTVAAIRLE